MLNIRKHMCTILFVISIISINLLAACSSQKKVEPEKVIDIPQNATSEKINEVLKATPSSKEKNKESGISAENYDKNTFAGYEGQISFFYNEDGSVLYYKWFISEKDEKKAKEIYADVCGALEGSYGDGTESNNKASGLYTTSFTNDKQQITAQLQKANDGGYEISYMVVG